jgi:hypothetical protein
MALEDFEGPNYRSLAIFFVVFFEIAYKNYNLKKPPQIIRKFSTVIRKDTKNST